MRWKRRGLSSPWSGFGRTPHNSAQMQHPFAAPRPHPPPSTRWSRGAAATGGSRVSGGPGPGRRGSGGADGDGGPAGCGAPRHPCGAPQRPCDAPQRPCDVPWHPAGRCGPGCPARCPFPASWPGFAWWIRAWRWIGCTGMHQILHGARIHHDLFPGRRTTGPAGDVPSHGDRGSRRSWPGGRARGQGLRRAAPCHHRSRAIRSAAPGKRPRHPREPVRPAARRCRPQPLPHRPRARQPASPPARHRRVAGGNLTRPPPQIRT